MLAVAEIGTALVCAMRKANLRQHLSRRLTQLGFLARIAPEAERMTGMRLHRQCHIVEGGEIEKQRGDLERAREPERATLMDRQRRDVAIGEEDAAGIGCNLARELPD